MREVEERELEETKFLLFGFSSILRGKLKKCQWTTKITVLSTLLSLHTTHGPC